ncbi:hypothetical protein BKA81DRAFT_380709 [Phyllosticta paracitricarpa]
MLLSSRDSVGAGEGEGQKVGERWPGGQRRGRRHSQNVMTRGRWTPLRRSDSDRGKEEKRAQRNAQDAEASYGQSKAPTAASCAGSQHTGHSTPRAGATFLASPELRPADGVSVRGTRASASKGGGRGTGSGQRRSREREREREGEGERERERE